MSAEIFRSVKERPDTTTKLHTPKTTMRPPRNIPYVVDNLWEWKRPREYPSRRSSVYASPSADIAKKSGPKDGRVFRVEFAGNYLLCRVKEYEDSKMHPECLSLRQMLFKDLGQTWIDSTLIEKEDIGRLWIPCLTKQDIDRLFGTIEQLRAIRDKVFESISYWEGVELIKGAEPLSKSPCEIFFSAKDGYFLRAE